ncbi:hypothetical protein BKA66DRAFT_473879 [Pyrenochaeta sp. MPI-SDFR-AT-0127]|nr:hypothetical protein BKA66DRAFT_473879 [Pyrenochaeta sp. MPI-SDFR-AT-0127]
MHARLIASQMQVIALRYIAGSWRLQNTSLGHSLADAHTSELQYLFIEQDCYSTGEQLPQELVTYFQVPEHMLSDVYRRSNGFYNSEKIFDKDGNLETFFTQFRFLVKFTVRGDDSRYLWNEMTFFSRWSPGQCAIICIGVPASLHCFVQKVIPSMWSKLSSSQPFALHVPLMESIVAMHDTSIWSIRDKVRNIEKGRSVSSNGVQDSVRMHETARHAIHSFETLTISVQTLESMRQEISDLRDQGRQADTVQIINLAATDRILACVDCQIRMLRNFSLRAQSNKDRLQNEIALAYSMIAQRDSQVMASLGEAARLDSGDMRTIAVVTLVFLPPTFLSALFSMSFFSSGSDQAGGPPNKWSMSEKFWIYWAFAIPLTSMTMAIWFWRQRQTTRRLKAPCL